MSKNKESIEVYDDYDFELDGLSDSLYEDTLYYSDLYNDTWDTKAPIPKRKDFN